MGDDHTRARVAADAWSSALLAIHHQDEEAAKGEVRQLLIDALDVVEQSPLEDDILRALDALEGKATGPQDEFKDAVHKDRDQLHEAVDVFLRQRMRPGEPSRVFPASAVAALEAALEQSRRLES
jgi:hypothetical protein